ncbi:MAG: AAA family ATPase [Gemmatimonadota bacterium]
MTPPRVHIRTLGGAEARAPGADQTLAGKPLALFLYLAVERRDVARDEMAELLWPASERSRARQSVRQALYHLRSRFGPDVVLGDDPVRVALTPEDVDLEALEHCLSHGRPSACLDLYGGPFLAGFSLPDAAPFMDWVEERRLDLARRLARALHDEALGARAAGDVEGASLLLGHAARIHPESQPVRLSLIEALLDQGRVEEARQALSDLFRDLEPTGEAREQAREFERRISLSTQARASVSNGAPELPLVGRNTDLAQLLALSRDAGRGITRVGLLAGPPGIGRSRLLAEARRSLAGSATWLGLRLHAGDERHRFGAVADLAEALLALPGAAGIHAASDELLRILLPGSPRSSELAALESVPLSGALRDLIDAVSGENALVVAIDDVHWMDPDSQAVFGRTFLRLTHARCLLLLSAADPLERRGLDALRGLLDGEEVARVRLRPLTLDQVAEAVDSAMDVDPPDTHPRVAQELHRLTAGLPLHLAAALRALRERGWIARREDRWVLDARQIERAGVELGSLADLLTERFGRLSAEARQVATTLASGGSAAADDPPASFGVAPAEFERVVQDLLERGLVERTEGGRLVFVHESLREVALRAQDAGRPAGSEASALRRLAGIVVLATLVFGWLGFVRWQNAQPPFPFGEGHLIAYGPDGVLAIRAPERDGGPWVVQPAEEVLGWAPAFDPLLRHVRAVRTPEDGVRWYATWDRQELQPAAVELTPRGTAVRYDSEGDDAALGASADGHTLLVASENGVRDPYALDLQLVREDGAVRPLVTGTDKIAGAWSPDGTRILAVLTAAVDSLVLLSPSGTRLWSRAVEPFTTSTAPAWCADSRHAVVGVFDHWKSGWIVVDTDTGEWEVLSTERMPAPVVCFGDGVAVAGTTRGTTGLPEIEIRDLRRGANLVLARISGTAANSGNLSWLPVRAPRAPASLAVLPDSVVIPWGDSVNATARLRSWVGEEWVPEEVQWRSLDANIASVDSLGRISGNGPGRTGIVADYASWLNDTVVVDVRGEPREDVLLLDRFTDASLAQWQERGDPQPRAVSLADGPALRLLGDGRYSDGIISRQRFRLARGFTLEMRIRYRSTRRDRQRWELCLLSSDADTIVLQAERYSCLVYPLGELAKWDSTRAGLSRQGLLPRIADTGDLGDDQWHHVALQVRADGETSVVVDRQVVLVTRDAFPIRADLDWRVGIHGHAVDTEMYVRDVTLWEGIRYSTDGVPDGPS